MWYPGPVTPSAGMPLAADSSTTIAIVLVVWAGAFLSLFVTFTFDPRSYRLKNGRVQDVTPGPESGMNVRTRIHEYGGGDYVVSDQFCFFVNFTDQQIYSQRLDGDTATDPKAITSGDSNTR